MKAAFSMSDATVFFVRLSNFEKWRLSLAFSALIRSIFSNCCASPIIIAPLLTTPPIGCDLCVFRRITIGLPLPPILVQKGGSVYHVPRLVERDALCRAGASVLPVVTVLAEQLQVVPVQRDCWIIDVLWGQQFLMVNDQSRLSAPLAQTESRSKEGIPAPTPRRAVVKPLGKLSRHSSPPFHLERISSSELSS